MKRIASAVLFMLAISSCAGPRRFVSNGELRGVFGRSVNSYECDEVDYYKQKLYDPGFVGFFEEEVRCWWSGRVSMTVVTNRDLGTEDTKIVRVSLSMPGGGFRIDDVENHPDIKNRAFIVLTMGREQFAKAQEEFDSENK